MIYRERPEGFTPVFEVASCFLERDGQILLLQRLPHKPQGGTYGAPAGKVEASERPIDTIRREIREETGYALEEQNLRLASTVYVRYADYDFTYHTFHHDLVDSSEPKIETAAHAGYVWVTPQEALALPLIPDMETCIRDFYNI
jgi:8-oxo-dGTP pyrophosphatase MutT (NUDIX family)